MITSRFESIFSPPELLEELLDDEDAATAGLEALLFLDVDEHAFDTDTAAAEELLDVEELLADEDEDKDEDEDEDEDEDDDDDEGVPFLVIVNLHAAHWVILRKFEETIAVCL